MMLGDYTGKESEVPVEDRDPININKDNFNDVMSGMNLSMDLNIHDTLSEQDDDEMSVHLDIKSINGLGPDSIAKQVPELNDMLEMRKALLALKGPLGNVPAFRKTIQKILNDDETRSVIMQELGIDDNQES